MSRIILEQTKEYLLRKENRTEEENRLLSQIETDLQYFYMNAFTRDEIKEIGYDITHITDETLQDLADKCRDNWSDSIKSMDIEMFAADLNMPARGTLYCPKCNTPTEGLSSLPNHPGKVFIFCDKCDHEQEILKSELWVLAEYPNNVSLLQIRGIGFPSYESQDRHARYVKEEEFEEYLGEAPNPNQYYAVVIIKEVDKPDKFDEYAEPIMEPESVKAFGENAYWVPICYM